MPGLTGLHLIGFRRDRREAVFLFLAYHWPQAGYGVSGKSSAIHIALNLDLTSVLENTGVCPLVAQYLSSAAPLRYAPGQLSVVRRLVPAEGFEPPTTRLRSGCSTAELLRLFQCAQHVGETRRCGKQADFRGTKVYQPVNSA